jgi:hypothetical protein
MALALRPRIDFGSRLTAIRAVCEDLGLPANQVPDQNTTNNARTNLKYINYCRAVLSLPLYTSLDYGSVVAALNAIAAAAGAAKPENVTAPFVSSNATPPVLGSVLSCTTGTWLNAAGATYAYQWKKSGVNIGTNASTYTLLAGDVNLTPDAVFTCAVTATTGAGASTPSTSNQVVVP